MASSSGTSYNGVKAMAFGRQTYNQSILDKVDPSMREYVDEYWGQFPPVDSLWYSIIIFVLIIIFILAISGNLMVIFIFSTTKSLKTPSNLLVINLAIADFSLIFFMVPPMIINCYNETWMFGPAFCDLYGMLGSLFGCASIWTMAAISVDRFNVIARKKPTTTGTAIFYIFLVWLTSLIWTVAPIVGWGRYKTEGNLTTCASDYFTLDTNNISYLISYILFSYLLPLKFVIRSFWYINSAVSGQEKNAQSVDYKLAKICLTTIILWYIAWTPYVILCMIGLYNPNKITPTYSIWATLFGKANATYNPIVYAIRHPKYRAALHQKFPSLSCADPAPPADNDKPTA